MDIFLLIVGGVLALAWVGLRFERHIGSLYAQNAEEAIRLADLATEAFRNTSMKYIALLERR